MSSQKCFKPKTEIPKINSLISIQFCTGANAVKSPKIHNSNSQKSNKSTSQNSNKSISHSMLVPNSPQSQFKPVPTIQLVYYSSESQFHTVPRTSLHFTRLSTWSYLSTKSPESSLGPSTPHTISEGSYSPLQRKSVIIDIVREGVVTPWLALD